MNGYFQNDDNATINADSFSVSLSGDLGRFYNSNFNDARIISNNFSVSISGDNSFFSNDRSINVDSFNAGSINAEAFLLVFLVIIVFLVILEASLQIVFLLVFMETEAKLVASVVAPTVFIRSITADKFNVNVYGVGKEFLNTHSANINANEFSVNLSGDNSDFVNEVLQT